MHEQSVAVREVDEILDRVGLPKYSLLFESLKRANQLILLPSATRVAKQQLSSELGASLPTCSAHSDPRAKQENESFVEWSIRYVDFYLNRQGEFNNASI